MTNNKNNYPLIDILPYNGKYVAPLILLIKLKIDDKILAGKEVWNLFKEKGVDPNSHNFS